MRTFSYLILASLFAAAALAQNDPADYVAPHNTSRAAVGVGPVTWNTTIATYAQNYANQLVGACQLAHSGGPYGENLFWGYGKNYAAADAVAAWVAEEQYYDYQSNSCQTGRVCGHYTQVVWEASTQIGCGRAVCSGGAVIIVCDYYTPGNIVGQRPY